MQLTQNSVRLLSGALAAAAAACALFLPAAAAAQTAAYVDARPVSTPHQSVLLIIDGKVVEAESVQMSPRAQQVMVWLRDLERLGWGKVEVASREQVALKNPNVTLTFMKNQSLALVNSLAVQLPISTYVKDGRLMVPLSFVAKALGYRYEMSPKVVASVMTAPSRSVERGNNAIEGKLLYNGKGVEGVTVRAVDADFWAIEGAVTRSDSEGNFRIDGLPDGDYKAHIWINDNPSYFNRASETVSVSGGQTGRIEPIALGRALTPLTPEPGESILPLGRSIEFAWSVCEGADKYVLIIKRHGTGEVTATVEAEKPAATIAANKFRQGVVYEAQVNALNSAGDYLGGTAGVGGVPWTFTIESITDSRDA